MTRKQALHLAGTRMRQKKLSPEEQHAASMLGIKPQQYYTAGAYQLYKLILEKIFLKDSKTADIESGYLDIDFRNKRGGFTNFVLKSGSKSLEWATRNLRQFIDGGLMHKEGEGEMEGKIRVKVTPEKLREFPDNPQELSKTQKQRAKDYREKKKAELEILKSKAAQFDQLQGGTQ